MSGHVHFDRLSKIPPLSIHGSSDDAELEAIARELVSCLDTIDSYKKNMGLTGQTQQAALQWLSRYEAAAEQCVRQLEAYAQRFSQAKAIMAEAKARFEEINATPLLSDSDHDAIAHQRVLHQRHPMRYVSASVKCNELTQLAWARRDAQALAVLTTMNNRLVAEAADIEKPVRSDRPVSRASGSKLAEGGRAHSATSHGAHRNHSDASSGSGHSLASRLGSPQAGGVALVSGVHASRGLGSWMSAMRGNSYADTTDDTQSSALRDGSASSRDRLSTSAGHGIRPDGPVNGYASGSRDAQASSMASLTNSPGPRFGLGGSNALMAGGIVGAGAAGLGARAAGSGLSGMPMSGPNAAALFSRGVPGNGVVSVSPHEVSLPGVAVNTPAAATPNAAAGNAGLSSSPSSSSVAGSAGAARGAAATSVVAPITGSTQGEDTKKRRPTLVGYDVFRLEEEAADEHCECDAAGAGSAQDLTARSFDNDDRW